MRIALADAGDAMDDANFEVRSSRNFSQLITHGMHLRPMIHGKPVHASCAHACQDTLAQPKNMLGLHVHLPSVQDQLKCKTKLFCAAGPTGTAPSCA